MQGSTPYGGGGIIFKCSTRNSYTSDKRIVRHYHVEPLCQVWCLNARTICSFRYFTLMPPIAPKLLMEQQTPCFNDDCKIATYWECTPYDPYPHVGPMRHYPTFLMSYPQIPLVSPWKPYMDPMPFWLPCFPENTVCAFVTYIGISANLL